MDMRKITPALLALLAALSSFAAIPVKWTTDTFKVKPLAYECYHGETLNLAASLTSYGEPLHLGGKTAHLYFQTEGMGDDWYITNATVAVDQETGATNVLSAIWSGEYDTGKDRVTGFIGVEGENYRASFVLTLRASPGFEPSDLPLPTKEIDCAKVVFKNATNAPFASEGKVVDAIRSYDETNLTARLNAKQGTLTAGENITIDANNVISATGGGGGSDPNAVTNVFTNGVSAVVGKVARITIPSIDGLIDANTATTIVSSASVTNQGAVADAAAKYLPLTGGTVSGELTIAQGGWLITTDIDDKQMTTIGDRFIRSGYKDENFDYEFITDYDGEESLSSLLKVDGTDVATSNMVESVIGSKGYIEDESDPVWNDEKANYLTTQTASTTYQPLLTAGDNITIANNTISATVPGDSHIGSVAVTAVSNSSELWTTTNTKLTNTIVGVNLNYLTNANSRAWSATAADNSVIKRIDNLEAEIVGVNALLETALGGNN